MVRFEETVPSELPEQTIVYHVDDDYSSEEVATLQMQELGHSQELQLDDLIQQSPKE